MTQSIRLEEHGSFLEELGDLPGCIFRGSINRFRKHFWNVVFELCTRPVIMCCNCLTSLGVPMTRDVKNRAHNYWAWVDNSYWNSTVTYGVTTINHYEVIIWKCFTLHWPFVWEHRTPVDSPHKRPLMWNFDIFIATNKPVEKTV